MKGTWTGCHGHPKSEGFVSGIVARWEEVTDAAAVGAVQAVATIEVGVASGAGRKKCQWTVLGYGGTK
jgi:uncharacterized membrane protein